MMPCPWRNHLTILFHTDFLQNESKHACGGCSDPSWSDKIPGCTIDGLYSGTVNQTRLVVTCTVYCLGITRH